ncbi:MAG: anthrone oxygenase family protein [Pseudomonadota bacterium]
MSLWFMLLLEVTIVAYAVVGGVVIAFSDFIMRSLAQTNHGDRTMQVINREVFRWVFMTLFIGLAPVSLGIAAYGMLVMGGVAGKLIMLAGLTYLIGCFGVTIWRNVPMNNALANLEAGTRAATTYWEETYVPRWTFWNSVRATACIAAAALLLIANVWSAYLLLG